MSKKLLILALLGLIVIAAHAKPVVESAAEDVTDDAEEDSKPVHQHKEIPKRDPENPPKGPDADGSVGNSGVSTDPEDHKIKHEETYETKQRHRCHSATDCVTLITEDGARLRLDDLNFEKDSIRAVLKKLPVWFGPRPATFWRGEEQVDEKKTMKSQNFDLAEEVLMKPEGTQIPHHMRDHYRENLEL